MTAKKQKKTMRNFLPGDKACGCLQDSLCPDHHAQMAAAADLTPQFVACPHCDEMIELCDVPQTNFMAVGCHLAAKHIELLVSVLLGEPVEKPATVNIILGDKKPVKRTRPGECPGIVPPLETIYLNRPAPEKKEHYSGCVDPFCGGCVD